LEYEELGMVFAGNTTITINGTTDEEEVVQCGICPHCNEDTQLLRGECTMCGFPLDKLLGNVGSILNHSDIERENITRE
jgi:hypothetical protein